MENCWYFPTSYEDWKNDCSIEVENNLFPDDVMVSQPVEAAPTIGRRKKKKRLDNSICDTFRDKYVLSEEVLGRGAKSLVTAATEKKSGREFAVKIIEKYDGYDRGSVLREIDLLHYLSDCPNVLHLHDSYEEDESFYLVFERMEGGPLLSHIESKTTFTEREASFVVKDIATALKFLHDKGISHRDLKPDNILCMRKDEVVPAVICDFNLASGISIIEDHVTTPELYTPVGSAEYMAPEVVESFVSDAVYDKKCDLWSLGVILYTMLCGHAPFQGECGEQCDWERGGSCVQCKGLLWRNILNGVYTMTGESWQGISSQAKDLISHLLVKEASKRYSIDDVLAHPWLQMPSDKELNTPSVLASSNITRRLSCVTSEAMACRRVISERQSNEEKHTRWSDSPIKVSPPAHSSLAKRRSLKNNAKLLTPLSLTPQQNDTPVASPDVDKLLEQMLTIDINNKEFKTAFKSAFLNNNNEDKYYADASTPTVDTNGWSQRH